MRSREPRLTVRALRPLMSGLMTLGYDPVPFLHTQGIDGDMLLDPDATVPMSACVGLLDEGVRATRDDNLGLHVAERAELGSFDVHFYAMVSSPTLGAAFERVCRYQRLIHETSQVRLEKSGIAPSCRIVWPVAWPPPVRPPSCSLQRGCAPAASPLTRGGVPLRCASRIARHAIQATTSASSVLHCALRPVRMRSYSRRRCSTCRVVALILRCWRFLINTQQTGSPGPGRRRSPKEPARLYPRNCRQGTLRLTAWRRASRSAFGRFTALSRLRERRTGGFSISYASTSRRAISRTIACQSPKSRFWWDSRNSALFTVRSNGGPDARR